MLKKLCKCGKIIPITEKQCEECRRKYQKSYDRYSRSNQEVYKDKRWTVLRQLCRENAGGIDLYHLYKYKEIIPGTLAHHIVEVSEDMERAFDIENLFWLSDRSHKEVHAIYERGKDSKEELQKLLRFLNQGRWVRKFLIDCI